MLQTQLQPWHQKAQRLLKKEPGKAGLLAALLLILCVMAGRVLMSDNPSPVAALGAHANLRVDNADQFLAPGSRAAAAGGASRAVLSWLDAPAAPLVRNPFSIRYELFPPEVTKSESVPTGRGFWDEIAKSLTVQVDQEEKKQEMLQDLQARASELQVATVMMGPSPRAMINDKFVGEGDVVANFRVLKIEARRIIVESEGIRLEIQMK